ncbi:unnamed protein product, partial [Meganyctiphanes norvegica]
MRMLNMFYTLHFDKLMVFMLYALVSISFGTHRDADYYRHRWSQRNSLVVPHALSPQITSVATSIQNRPSVAPQSSQQLVSPIIDVPEDSYQLDKQLGSGNQRNNISINNRGRDPRFFPLFRFVTIKADMCTTVTGENGTCYTSDVCTSLGGGAGGKCAGG